MSDPERDPRDSLVHDLYTWGPALSQEIRARFPRSVVLELIRERVIARKKFTGFEVLLLSGVGLRPYGYALRYNYVPARNVVLASLLVRRKAREFADDGYQVTLYNGYAKRGRDNMLLVEKDGVTDVVLCRASFTLKSLRNVATSIREDLPDIQRIQVFVFDLEDNDQLLRAQMVNGLSVVVSLVQQSAVTHEAFRAEEKDDRLA